ncbi:MAG: hypothetical protein JF588_15950 [Caulobacterales bacterium]|nr:hypothetical protein [Caulobacterales bacterium]
MKVPILVCTAAAALMASSGAAQACRPHHHRAVYYGEYRHPYARRVVYVRERVWRPAPRRVVYVSPEPVRVYRYASYAPRVVAYDDDDAGYGYGYGARYVTVRSDGWRHERYERRCHHRHWDD